MLSLWSRAGQAHHCGCRACNSAINGLSRRATTAARRRKPTFGELFTACYSSVFASAVIVDAIQKEDRRQALDKQLETARRELAELREQALPHFLGAESETESLDLNHVQQHDLTCSLQQLWLNRPYMKEIHKPAQHSISQLVEKLKSEHYQSAPEQPPAARRRVNYEELEQAVIAEEFDQTIRTRQPLNRKQLLREQDMTIRLIRELMERVSAKDKSGLPSPSFDEAQQLLANAYPKYTFRSLNQWQAHQNTLALNKAIRTAMSATDLGWKEKVGQVCYNILVSAHAPDMLTYNTMIVAFDSVGDQNGLHTLAESVVSSFFFARHLRPTPVTYRAILNHYKATSNHGRFLRTLSCIVGLDERTGAKTRRRNVLDVTEEPSLTRWAMNPIRRTVAGQFVNENFPLTTDLVDSIMSGLVYFKLFEQAASLFLTCIQSGVTLSAKVIRDLVDGCIVNLDWSGAVHLVRAFTACDIRQPHLIQSGKESDFTYLLKRIPIVLDMCGLYPSGRQPAGNHLVNIGISNAELDRLLDSLEDVTTVLSKDSTECVHASDYRPQNRLGGHKSRLLQIESLFREYVRVRNTTNSIESKLLKLEIPNELRISLAGRVIEEASRRSMELNAEYLELLDGRAKTSKNSLLMDDGCQSFESKTGNWLNAQTQRVFTPSAAAQESNESELNDSDDLQTKSQEETYVPPYQDDNKHGRSRTQERRMRQSVERKSRWSTYTLATKPWVAGSEQHIQPSI
ncbi:hypothetical protein HJFPF1_06313 [Paramyrothecium foliicola]|nr:hypothetical protein HJFPF1_06313 [Paramyrothecium foliicola]